jgi:DNA invertase Pin-like site-specific DNA recombinase
MTQKTWGYMRVSTGHQTTDRQEDALVAAGVDPRDVYRDVISGAKFERVGLEELIGRVEEHDGERIRRGGVVRAGDTVIVASLDRLGRSLSEVIRVADELHAAGIVLKTIKESIDYSTAIGKMLAGIFGSLAEYERTLMLERVSDARAAAKARGTNTGRPSTLTTDQKRQIQRLHAAGESVASLVETFKVSRRTVYRALENATQPALSCT